MTVKASVVLSVACSREHVLVQSKRFDLEPNTDYYFFVGTTDPAECGTFEFTTTGIFLGCTDPAADNYYDIANQDDGSCEYSSCLTTICAKTHSTSHVTQVTRKVQWVVQPEQVLL